MASDAKTLEIPLDIDGLFDDLFAQRWEVVILDSPYTTFAEVEKACIDLFSYTLNEAKALALKVHNHGEAIAAIMSEREARDAQIALAARNVRSRIQRV